MATTDEQQSTHQRSGVIQCIGDDALIDIADDEKGAYAD